MDNIRLKKEYLVVLEHGKYNFRAKETQFSAEFTLSSLGIHMEILRELWQ